MQRYEHFLNWPNFLQNIFIGFHPILASGHPCLQQSLPFSIWQFHWNWQQPPRKGSFSPASNPSPSRIGTIPLEFSRGQPNLQSCRHPVQKRMGHTSSGIGDCNSNGIMKTSVEFGGFGMKPRRILCERCPSGSNSIGMETRGGLPASGHPAFGKVRDGH